MRRLTLALLLLVAVGCGASDPDRAEQAVRGYLDALATGDWNGACDRLDVTAELQLARMADAFGAPCPQTAEAVLAGRDLSALATADLGEVRVLDGGSEAFVALRGGGTVRLLRDGDRYLIARLPED